MTTYFILDPYNNTWSDTHYPLSSILATPGITEEQILANARTQETLTVAQAKVLAKASTPKLKPVAAGGAISGKPTSNKTLTMGMSFNREKPKPKAGGHLSLSSIPKKSDREYKVISQSDRIFNGQFTAQKLSQILNAHAQKGWRVINFSTAPVYTEEGYERNEMMVLLEKATV